MVRIHEVIVWISNKNYFDFTPWQEIITRLQNHTRPNLLHARAVCRRDKTKRRRCSRTRAVRYAYKRPCYVKNTCIGLARARFIKNSTRQNLIRQQENVDKWTKKQVIQVTGNYVLLIEI